MEIHSTAASWSSQMWMFYNTLEVFFGTINQYAKSQRFRTTLRIPEKLFEHRNLFGFMNTQKQRTLTCREIHQTQIKSSRSVCFL